MYTLPAGAGSQTDQTTTTTNSYAWNTQAYQTQISYADSAYNSSGDTHFAGRADRLVAVGPLLDRIDEVAVFLAEDEDPAAAGALRAAETTGRPLGDEAFIQGLEKVLGRRLARGRPGPARRRAADPDQPELWG